MSDDRDEWIRLPGLFRWEEVCAVFAEQAGRDDHWRFDVRKVTGRPSSAALFVVYASPPAEPRGAAAITRARRS